MKSFFHFWLRAALALLLNLGCLGHAASAFFLVAPPTQVPTITYDDHTQGNAAYDCSYRSAFSYDGGATPAGNEYGHQFSGSLMPFGIFSDFIAADNASVIMAEGTGIPSKSLGGTVYYGAYDPAGNTVYLGDMGHAGGMAQAGGTPLPGVTPGITVAQTPTGVIWANDSWTLGRPALTAC